MNLLLTSTRYKHACLVLMAGTGVFVGFRPAHSQAPPVAETIIGTYHVPDLPQWKKVVRNDATRDLAHYDKAVPEGSMTFEFRRFLQTQVTPAITKQQFVKDMPRENKLLKSMLAAISTKVLSFSTQTMQFQGAPAYLTQFRILRNQRLEEDKNLIFLAAGERYELDLIARQDKPSVGTDRAFPIGKEAQQAWNTVFNGLTKLPAK